jgi:hypothetical protein
MDHRLPATLDMARVQPTVREPEGLYHSVRADPEVAAITTTGRNREDGGEPAELWRNRTTASGREITIGIYAINAATQRCKWMAIDADYKTALEDL